MAKDNKFECPKKHCAYASKNKHCLREHLQSHDPHSISCPQPKCSYTTNTERKLRSHMLVHSEEEHRFHCSFCPFTCHRSNQLVIHVRTHTGETPYKCSETGCNYKTAQSCKLKVHAKVHSDIKQFKCPFCTLSMKYKNNLQNHLRKFHGEDLSSMASNPCKICHFSIDSVNCFHSIKTPFQCPNRRCKFRSRTEEKLNGHQLTHCMEKHLECLHSPCEFRTRDKRYLKQHIKLHEENPKKIYQCPLCPYKSKIRQNVSSHLKSRVHNGVERQGRLKCPNVGCSYLAFNNNKLTQHLTIHNTEKLLKCPEPDCSFRTNQQELLNRHAKFHSEEKPWHCNFCLKTFRQPSSLSSHILTHTKETLFKCPKMGCEFQANIKAALTGHLRKAHWKIRPHKCATCKNSATRKSPWKNQQRQAHKIVVETPSFECTVSGCGVIARNEKGLAIHFTSKHNLPRVLVTREMI